MSADLSRLTSEAEGGDPEAQLQLAELYDSGFGISADRGQAVVWYRRAADQGSPRGLSASSVVISAQPGI